METLKQRILENIADLLDEPTFELDMRLADCIDPLPSDKSELHLMMAEASFKVLCNYFGKQDETEQYAIHSVIVPRGALPYPYKHQLERIDQLSQTQTPLSKQMEILRPFANKLGLYDAADYIKID